MENNKWLGKITDVKFGHIGYQECEFGISLTFESKGIGIAWTQGFWDPHLMKRSENAQWTESDRAKGLSDLCYKISELLAQAKVHDVYELKGIPVEVTTENMRLKEFRILTEVL